MDFTSSLSLLLLCTLSFGGVEANFSRNALSQSTKMSFGRRGHSSSSLLSNSKNVFDQVYEDGSYFDVNDVDEQTTMASVSSSSLNSNSMNDVQLCTASAVSSVNPFSNPLIKNLARGAFLRVASDISGGTALENIKCRVTATSDDPIEATKTLITGGNGIWNLWSGTPSRTLEGALMGAVFLVGSASTKKRMLAMGFGKNAAATAGGVVGGVAQTIIMTPCGLIFTSLNVNKGKKGFEDDNAYSVAKRIVKEKGFMGLYIGSGPMAIRQASNWASRSLLTEICRTNLKLSRFGLLGEIGSGAIGGVGATWNTPIETVRVFMQRDVSEGKPPKPAGVYFTEQLEEGGIRALYRGVTPRAIQGIWQTIFMVVFPNLLGI